MAEEKFLLRELEAEIEDKPELAEQSCRKALAQAEALFRDTGEPEYGRLARELALSLADQAMEQGNMHGADMWYVKAMVWEKTLKTE